MFSKELENLIKATLEDGKLTDLEKKALVKRAQNEGVDLDELEIYIDSILQKRERELKLQREAEYAALDATKRQAKGKLCPFCEASVPMFTDKCPKCGSNITPQATKELEEIIDKLEDALVNFKDSQNIARSKAEVERYIRKAELYYESNSKVQKLLTAVKLELKNAEKSIRSEFKSERRRNLLNNFLTNKFLWWLLIMFISIVLLGSSNENLQWVGFIIMMLALGIGSWMLIIYAIWKRVKKESDMWQRQIKK